MNLAELDTSHPYTATLLANDLITLPDSKTEVRHLVLQLPSHGFHFMEGQSIGVLAPGPYEFGNSRHLRLYSIASPREGENGGNDTISLCVRRCFYIDEVSGEAYPGKASNYLCDLNPGVPVEFTGPYGVPFQMPPDDACNILMVGAGTGIAPFRAFIKHIYERRGGWKGKVRLFYGARTGMDLLYRNEYRKDLGLYYSDESFRAFEAVSPRPYFDGLSEVDRLLVENAREIWEMVQDPRTYVYLAGLTEVARKFQKSMIAMAGYEQTWNELRDQLIEQKRYTELLYE
jgi:ferredoxin--NADP+ reductase